MMMMTWAAVDNKDADEDEEESLGSRLL